MNKAWKNIVTGRTLGCVFAVLVFLVAAEARAGGMDKFLAFGTSTSKSGAYYPIGKGICQGVNAARDEHGIRCISDHTGGSVYNLPAITSGELDLALTRSDLAYESYVGEGTFKPFGPSRDLRLIAPLYTMPVAVLVKQGSGLTSFDDFPGMRINIGNLGSGKRTIADLLLQLMGWTHDDFEEVHELSTSKMVKAFCEDKFDVLIEATGIPSQIFDTAVDECDGVFLDLPPALLSRIEEIAPFYQNTVIPGEMYASNPNDILTFGVDVVLITSARLHEESIYIATQSIFDDLRRFRKHHPALRVFNADERLGHKPVIPIHPGAMRYFMEKGLVQ